MRPRTAFALALGLGLSLAACAQKGPEPQLASSSAQPSHAAAYGDELEHLSGRIQARSERARQIFSGFFGYGKALKSPKETWVLQVYDRADAAGRSSAYVARRHEVENAAGFFDKSGDDIARKAGGAADFATKKAKCENVNAGGAVVAALKGAYDDELHDSLKEGNDAMTLIERYRETMGKEDATALEKQADEIASASFVVYVGLIEDRNEFRRLLAEANDVGKTADQYIADEKAFQGEAGRNDAEKKASEARIAEMTKAKARIQPAVEAAKPMDAKLDKDIEAIQKEYADAFKELRNQAKK